MTSLSGLLDRPLRVSAQQRDHVLVTLWIIVTFKQFRYDELILYPLAFYFLWAFIRDFTKIFPLLTRSWIVWLFPAWCGLSIFWGLESGQILKSNLQLLLTVIICFTAVLRLTPRQIALSVMIAAGFFGILSVLKDPTGGVSARGVFTSKNALGSAMVFLWVSSLCIALDREGHRLTRVVAFLLIPLSLYLIDMSDSATAVLLALGAFLIIMTLHFSSHLSPTVLIVGGLFLCSMVMVLIGVVAVTVHDANPVAMVLDAFGKDSTLTGRTVLWGYAQQEIAQRPLLGVGTGGFWTPADNLSMARRIHEEFYKAVHATFSFHNTYLEIAVHQGLIGLGFVLAFAMWAYWRLLGPGEVDQTLPSPFFITTSLVTLALSFTEVTLMQPFNVSFMLLTVGALQTLKSTPRPVLLLGPNFRQPA